jgi:hemolysin III
MTAAQRVKDYLVFPDYTDAERIADRVIHYIGVPLGIVAAITIVAMGLLHGGAILAGSIAIYAFGLIGMLTSSAAYQLAPNGLRKERLRRLDRAMIFVMIAGTYTPISANVLLGRGGIFLCAVQWTLAALGIFVTIKYPRRFERILLGLYLAMGWLLIVLIRYAFAALEPLTMTLIFAGGIAYTVGALINALPRLKFHNPIWHALILVAASCQYEAIVWQLLRGK